MPATQLPLALPPHSNKGLFSDYYLDSIVPTQNEWFDLHEAARPVWNRLRERFSTLKPEQLDESQLEQQWITFVLTELGWHYSVQVKIRYGATGNRRPDYALTGSHNSAQQLTNQIYTPVELRDAGVLAVADAKKWAVPLDQAPHGERNPSQQIDEYLRFSELRWGILTDGRTWRLYERDTSKNNVFYAVDLKTLLESNDDEALNRFLYFYAFFQQAAFTEGGWLDRTLAGSTDFAQSLSDTLEDQVYDALELIAQGFLDYRRNALKPTPETLRELYEQSLVLLYRLLFILYAESRDILPLSDNAAYRENRSLHAIKYAIVQSGGHNLDDDGSDTYGRLKDLFFGIDQGNPRYNLPAYNGGLFAAADHPFLDKYTIGDRRVAAAIDKMARIPDKSKQGALLMVDYRDLDVRHLGAIYEKLLEYVLDFATEPLTINDDLFVPAQPGDKVAKKPGEVFLRTGNNQRKVTGSYYTPDYIVRFIVERTLEPLLTAITERYATRDEEGRWTVHEPDTLRNAILALNVLDPATGSGHFMVDTMAYIAEWLRGLALAPVDLAPGEDELLYWKRQVVLACIYGLDVNPLAVELAKLSLWLATISRGRPLSFLDHHIQCGNTLVGARADEIGVTETANPKRVTKSAKKAAQAQEVGQFSMFAESDFAPTLSFAIDQMNAIEHSRADNIDQVKIQEAQYAALTARLALWRRTADVWTAKYFGVSFDQPTWKLLSQSLRGHLIAEIPGLRDIATRGEAIAHTQHFFHWELVFPEVFFAPDGTPKADSGFDAIVGNPPYVRQEYIQPIKNFLAAKYKIYQGTADLYLYFYEQCLRLLKPDQRLGFITAGTYMNSNSASEFRKYINDNAALETVLNFGENQPFRGAEMVYPTIAIMRKGEPKKTFRSLFIEDVVPFAEMEPAVERFDDDAIDSLADVTAMNEWRFQPAELTELFKKVTQGHRTLQLVANEHIYSGIKTGLSEVFVVDETTRERLISEHSSSADLLRLMMRGEDLRPWHQIYSGKYLILAKQGIKIDEFPAIKSYLSAFQSGLARRSEVVSGQCSWYELRPCDYYEAFSNPKILWADITKIPRFSWDETGVFCNDKGFIIVPNSKSLLAILNSRPIWFALSQIATPLRLRAGLWQYQAKIQFVERLPIPDLTIDQESQLAEQAEAITALARSRYALDEAMRGRIAADLGGDGKLNDKLGEWWRLPNVSELRTEVKKAFKRDIPLADRDDWSKYLADQRAKHESLTTHIVALETQVNAVVYAAFDLNPDEIGLIERATKYPYGEV